MVVIVADVKKKYDVTRIRVLAATTLLEEEEHATVVLAEEAHTTTALIESPSPTSPPGPR
jgi:hypothetical protein